MATRITRRRRNSPRKRRALDLKLESFISGFTRATLMVAASGSLRNVRAREDEGPYKSHNEQHEYEFWCPGGQLENWRIGVVDLKQDPCTDRVGNRHAYHLPPAQFTPKGIHWLQSTLNRRESKDMLRCSQCRRAVPTLVPKPGSTTVAQKHLPGRKSDALRALGSSWVMPGSEVSSLKIRVSEFSRGATNWHMPIWTPKAPRTGDERREESTADRRSAPEGRAKRVHSTPGFYIATFVFANSFPDLPLSQKSVSVKRYAFYPNLRIGNSIAFARNKASRMVPESSHGS